MDESKISLNNGWASHVSHRNIGKGFRLHTYIAFGQQLLSDHQLNKKLGSDFLHSASISEGFKRIESYRYHFGRIQRGSTVVNEKQQYVYDTCGTNWAQSSQPPSTRLHDTYACVNKSHLPMHRIRSIPEKEAFLTEYYYPSIVCDRPVVYRYEEIRGERRKSFA